MNRLTRDAIRDSRIRQSLLCLLLLSLTVALTGFFRVSPVSIAKSDARPTDQSQRYPCEDCPCGCLSAEYCWDKCCCHSDQEKLQWAARKGVTPPSFLVARVAATNRPAALPIAKLTSTTTSTCCCSSGSTPKSCSTSISNTDEAGPSDSQKLSGVAETKTILMWKAAECRGMSYFWSVLATVYVSAASVLSLDASFVQWMTLSDERVLLRTECPDPPVP